MERESGATGPPAGGPDATQPVAPGLGLPGSEFLKDFRVVTKVGEGAMGIVYRAYQVSLDREVALKILPPHIAANRHFVDRFIREARMSVRLDHPNIVRGLAVGEEQGVYYFAMEFVDGHSLDHYLEGTGKLSVGDTVRIISDVAHALHHAHSRNILHRDIKPSNIMVTREGDVKLADLGLAKIMDDDSDLTQVGEGAGTPAYMPLEQARNAREVTHRSDIYALGATMYHLLTGQRPFTGASAFEVLKAKETGQYQRASECNPEVPRVLDPIVDKAMASDPDRRYQDVGELATALEATGLANDALELLNTGTATVVTRPQPSRRPLTTRQPARPPSSRRVWVAAAGLAIVVIAGLVAWRLFPRAQPPTSGTASRPTPAAVAPTRPDAEPVDVTLARAVAQVMRGEGEQARATLERGLQDHPGEARLKRPLAELTQGVLILFQYQTPEETSPVVPFWTADGVTLTRRDNYRFAMIPGRECYVYAFQRDTRPSVTRVFPNKRYSPLDNPLTANAISWLPNNPNIKGPAWFYLDTSVGEERVFFVAVTKPLRDPDGLGERLVESPDGVRQALTQDLGSLLSTLGGPGATCFASEGGVLQSFAFNHR